MHSTYNGMATVLVIIITDREGKPMRSQVRQLVFSKNGHRNIFIRTCSSRTCHSLFKKYSLYLLPLNLGRPVASPANRVWWKWCCVISQASLFKRGSLFKKLFKKKKAFSFCLALSLGTFTLGPATMLWGIQATWRGYWCCRCSSKQP